MIDSINNASILTHQRTQSLTATAKLHDPQTLTAVQQSAQKTAGAQQTMTVFAVSQAEKSDAAPSASLPRGSLVDVLV